MGKGAGLRSHCFIEETGALRSQCGNRDSQFLTMLTHHCCCICEQIWSRFDHLSRISSPCTSLHSQISPGLYSRHPNPCLPPKAVSKLHCPFPCNLLLKCTWCCPGIQTHLTEMWDPHSHIHLRFPKEHNQAPSLWIVPFGEGKLFSDPFPTGVAGKESEAWTAESIFSQSRVGELGADFLVTSCCLSLTASSCRRSERRKKKPTKSQITDWFSLKHSLCSFGRGTGDNSQQSWVSACCSFLQSNFIFTDPPIPCPHLVQKQN